MGAPESLVDYVNKYIINHVSDKEVKEQIVNVNPVPKQH